MKDGRTAWVALAMAIVANGWTCGGKAVVDGQPGSGSGSGGSGGNTASVLPSTTSAAVCNFMPPVGNLFGCTGAVSSGTDMAQECAHDACDDGGHTYESDCTGQGCICKFNGVVACTCAIGVGQFCVGDTASCCPAPFPP